MKTIILDLRKPLLELEVQEDSQIVGMWVGGGRAELNSQIKIVHSKPGIFSRILIKATVADQSKFNLTATVRVAKAAKQTDTYLKLAALILSSTAGAKIVPSMEILTGDVKAGHGATVGSLHPDQLFYLQSHGLTSNMSKGLLQKAFLREVEELIKGSVTSGMLEQTG